MRFRKVFGGRVLGGIFGVGLVLMGSLTGAVSGVFDEVLGGEVSAISVGDYETTAKAIALYNGEGEELIAENADEELPVASLTKMMTAIVVLEDSDLALTEVVEISEEMLADLTEFSVVGLSVGDKATIEDLLYALMLPSAGDAGQALAFAATGTIGENGEVTGGSIEEFAAKMNEKAAEIGMGASHFSNPIGQDDDNYSTARDMAKLVFYALQNEEFVKIFSAESYDFTPLGKTITKTVSLAENNLTGAKTGFTNAAGRCLASTAERNGVLYVLVVLGAEGTNHILDTEEILEFYGENYGYREIFRAGEEVGSVGIRNGRVSGGGSEGDSSEILEASGEIELLAEEFKYFAKNDDSLADFRFELEVLTEINRRVAAGDLIGTLRVYNGEEEVFAQEFYLEEEVAYDNFEWAFAAVAGGAGVLILIIEVGQKMWKKRVGKRAGKNEEISGQAKSVSVKNEEVGKQGEGAGLKIRRGGFGARILRHLPAILVGAMAVGVEVALVIWVFFPSEPKFVTIELSREVGAVETEITETENVLSEEQAATTEAAILSEENCTFSWGALMLVNPNYTVSTEWIAERSGQLIDLTSTYGITEMNAGNGRPRLDAEAGEHLNEMMTAYAAENPGHTMKTVSCFRAQGTSCGRLCYATGTSDHHTGYTCDLIDDSYGTTLNTDDLAGHLEWQWLHENSYKYGFIDRFVENWAGGSMAEPMNVDGNGTTGLYETWHYRYVGVTAATEIATGKYNGGEYDSLEHYLKASGRIADLLTRTGCR